MRREQKRKSNKMWILSLLVIVVVIVAFYMIHDIQKRVENSEMNNEVNGNEEIEQNVVDENSNIVENVVENSMIENTSVQNTANNVVEEKNEASGEKNSTSTQTEAGVTDKKQKAIELVKNKWGEDDTVDYVFDYVNENGEYIIAVKDRASATLKYYFRVNLETENVDLD